MMETLRNKFQSLSHPQQAIFVGGLVGLVPAVLLATVEGMWLMVPPAVLAAGLVTGAVWSVGFGIEPFSVSRSIVLGLVASLLSCVAIWGVAALFVAINLGDSRFGFAMLVLGTLGLSIVVPLFLPFGIIATLLLRRSQCSGQRQTPVP